MKKDGGWDAYKELTDSCEELLSIVKDDKETIENVHERFEKIHKKIKFKSFGKTRVRKYKIESKKNEVNEKDVVDKITKQKSERLEQEIRELKSCSNSRPTRVFKLIEKIQGPKKGGLEGVAIVDPDTEELQTSRKEILDTTAKYCTNLLTNNKADEGLNKSMKRNQPTHKGT